MKVSLYNTEKYGLFNGNNNIMVQHIIHEIYINALIKISKYATTNNDTSLYAHISDSGAMTNKSMGV